VQTCALPIYAALPDVERIVDAIRRLVATKHERVAVEAVAAATAKPEIAPEERRPYIAPKIDIGKRRVQSITVPVMGEGIRNAKIVSLLKNPGDPIALDDELFEVGTDKAVYPIQSSFDGVMGEWKTKVGDTVEIGQELGTLFTDEASLADQLETASKESTDRKPVEAAVSVAEPSSSGRTARHSNIEPALSPTITRKLSRVIPANLQIDARWDAIRRARDGAKEQDGKNDASPSVMIAWSVVRAMEKHASFRRLILEDDHVVIDDGFVLGSGVAP